MPNLKKNLCRICLETDNLTDIFANNGPIPLAEKIMYCASVQVSPEDLLPSRICNQCLLYLNAAYVFRTVCERMDFKLRQQNKTDNDDNVTIKPIPKEIETKQLNVSVNSNNLVPEEELNAPFKSTEEKPATYENEVLQSYKDCFIVNQSDTELIGEKHTNPDLYCVNLKSNELNLENGTKIQKLFILYSKQFNYADVDVSSSLNEKHFCDNTVYRQELTTEENKPTNESDTLLLNITECFINDNNFTNHSRLLEKGLCCTQNKNCVEKFLPFEEKNSSTTNIELTPKNSSDKSNFKIINDEVDTNSENVSFEEIDLNLKKNILVNEIVAAYSKPNLVIKDKANEENEIDLFSNTDESRLSEQKSESSIYYEKTSSKQIFSEDESSFGNTDVSNHSNISVCEDAFSLNETNNLIINTFELNSEEVECEVINENQSVANESNSIFNKGCNEIKINHTDKNYLIGENSNMSRAEHIEESIVTPVRLIRKKYSLTPKDETTLLNEETNLLLKNYDKEAFKSNKVLVEENFLIDSVSDKTMSFKYQKHHNSFYHDHSLFLNDKDALLHNEQEEESGTSVKVVTEDIKHFEKYLNMACIQKDSDIVGIQVNESKHAPLSNISLHDFEAFEKEQLNNDSNQHALLAINQDESDNDKNVSSNSRSKSKTTTVQKQFENRVGRHIAKKNASQPPKRYSPALQTMFKIAEDSPNQNIKDDLSITERNIEGIDEIEEKLEKTVGLKDVGNMLDHEYILENDLSMPEPIFEETVITGSFCSIDDDTNSSDINSNEANLDPVDNQDPTKKDTNIQSKTRKQQKGICKKGSSKMNQHQKKIFRDQATGKWIQSKSSIKSSNGNSRYTIRVHRKKTKQRNRMPKVSDLSNYNGSNNLNNLKSNSVERNNDKLDYFVDDLTSCIFDDDSSDDYKNPQKNHIKRKLSTKKNKQKGYGINTTCEICNKSFPFPSHLQRHLTAHIGVKQFTCKYCNKQFLHSYNLSVHIRTHTGDFPLKCYVCNRGFASPSVLERHKRSHTGETPYQCHYCFQLFSHASSLHMHEKMHLNRPSFTCDICFKVFSYKSSLTAHKKGHSGVKPHSCSVCHKRFTRRTSVMRHMSCHSESKKFKCRTCNEVFNTRKSFVKHHKIQHVNM